MAIVTVVSFVEEMVAVVVVVVITETTKAIGDVEVTIDRISVIVMRPVDLMIAIGLQLKVTGEQRTNPATMTEKIDRNRRKVCV